MAKATLETPSKSDRPSLNVVSNAPAEIMMTPRVLPSIVMVVSNGEANLETTGATRIAKVVIATRRYSITTVPNAVIVAIGIVRLGLCTSSTKVAIRLYPV